MNENSMILSVCVRTYNQERFIAQALDGILMQKTSFPFEIIVSDDGSKDKTQEVLRDYHQRYPDRFRL
ncbi:MAG: glycosyltransferase, partial [Bacteroidales bacterium]|nr:glycosyltransferase [Bacteroidales bacterium]